MVNKHYTVQRQQHNPFNTKRFSPPPVRNSSIVSNAPNPTNANTLDDVNNFGETRDRRVLDTIREERKSEKSKNSSYGINISLANKMIGNHNTKKGSKGSKENQTEQQRAVANDHMEINDIGRFQYILQMDKEMGTHPDKSYRIPSRIQMPTNRQISVNSTNQNGHFWKAGSETPITPPNPNSRRKREEIYRHLVNFWKYAKWPLLVILCAFLLGTSIYFVVSDSNRPVKIPVPANFTDLDIPTENSVQANIVQEDNSTLEDSDGDENWELKLTSSSTEDLSSSVETTTEARSSSTSSTSYNTHGRFTNPSTIFRTKSNFLQHATHLPFTTVSPTRNTKILPIYTHAAIPFDEDIRSTAEPQKKNHKESNVVPTKDTFDIIGFTSGHQNSFGIPIEEDERILRILNEELMKQQAEEVNQTHKPTTDSSVNRPRVSPTLPFISRSIYSTTERLSPVNQFDNGNCQSTSLSICRGILQYDLTMNKTGKALTPNEEADFKELFDSNCSNRAAEFVCSVLEPECRPFEMGILRPCKRICRSILEECVLAIGTSDVLLSIFDCDSYPDSSDRNVCEDPTRRGRCHDDEFKCLDSSCIPQRWKCDNIKDCSLGEDEENCLHCDNGEFRCQSMDKCVPYKWRCDTYQDCPDGSDEMDCYDYEDDSTSSDNPREYAYASVQELNSPKNKPYLIISADGSNPEEGEREPYDDRFLPTAPDNESNKSDSDREENGDTQKGEASSRVLVGVPKSIANFQDSKEIMMTSDTENDFKYSKINQTISSTTVRTEELTPGPSQCPESELRCVSGECIRVEQICDKIVDCPDGADEAMCVYKETS